MFNKIKNNKMKDKDIIKILLSMACVLTIAVFVNASNNELTQSTSSTTISLDGLSTKKIEWGIKRNDNHSQPDLGSANKSIIDKYNGIAMGNKESKKVYLTFDSGYEAGYTEKILEVLKQNDVKATFFITAHYVNSQPELVQKMIDEGHTIGNQLPPSQMYQI